MSNTEKVIVTITMVTGIIYIVLFNLNIQHYWAGEPAVVSDRLIDSIWVAAFILGAVATVLCIVDTGKRPLNNRAAWVAYIVLFGVIGVPHYYFKYGRHSRSIST